MSIEKQREKVMNLLTLIEQNPDLRIVPMVETEVVADDGWAWWIASWGSASVEEIYNDDERVYIRSEDEDELVERLADTIEFTEDLHDEEALKRAEDEVKNYDWEKVIAVKITI